jgi:hypothetical protein
MWTSLATGAALAASAGVISIVGHLRARSIERKCGKECEESLVARESDQANLKQLARAVDVTGVVALAGLGTALGLWVWQRAERTSSARVSVVGRGVSYSVGF